MENLIRLKKWAALLMNFSILFISSTMAFADVRDTAKRIFSVELQAKKST
jgi:hypothetical protein